MTEKGKVLYMAMEITNNYSNFATNYADTVKKADSKATTEAKTNSKDKVQEYYEKLCKKFPQINFNTNVLIKIMDIFMKQLKVPQSRDEVITTFVDHPIITIAEEKTIKEFRNAKNKKEEINNIDE